MFFGLKGGLVLKPITNQIIQTDYLLDQQFFDNEQQNPDKVDIISDFKKKTFDEIKCDLHKQTQYSVEKFNKVLDFIQNELSPQLNTKEAEHTGSSNSTINMLSMSSLNGTPLSIRKPGNHKEPTSPTSSDNSKLICLSDIQFPRSFIY
jgi:hypothetical protein